MITNNIDIANKVNFAEDLKIFNREATFIAGANNISSLPKISLPQIAFVGRSNVGKSTLINLVCNRKKLVKTSRSPGHTKQINFFNIHDTFALVDLPGYGFSSVSHKIKESWSNLIWHYFKTSGNVRLVNILLDFRRDLRESDIMLMHMLQKLGIKFQAVITKIDKVKKDKTNVPQIINALHEIECYDIKFSGIDMFDKIKNIQLSILEVLK
jgi:GTP-binding protein